MTTNPEDPTVPTREPDPVPDQSEEADTDAPPPNEPDMPLGIPPLPRS